MRVSPASDNNFFKHDRKKNFMRISVSQPHKCILLPYLRFIYQTDRQTNSLTAKRKHHLQRYFSDCSIPDEKF